MPEPASPLSQSQQAAGLSHRPCSILLQYHAWPERYADMAGLLAGHCGLQAAPTAGKALSGAFASLLRVHPQRLWLLSESRSTGNHQQLPPETGAVLDLTHARTVIRVDDQIAVPLLSRFVAIDLRPDRFALDDIALTPIHRVGVVLWRRTDGIDILVPRSFARSIWEVLAEVA